MSVFFYLFLLFLISGIYVNVLDDIQKAIEYCEQVYNSNSKDKNKVRFISHDLILFICYELFYLFCKIFFGLTSHIVPLWP